MNLASRDPIIDYKSIEELEASIVQKHEARGIPRSMTAANVQYMSDIEYKDGEAIGHPIHDLLGWKFSRFGRNPNRLYTAVFNNEDGSIFQLKLNQRLYVSKKGKHGKAYRAPKDNGSILGKPSITLECWRAIAAKNDLPVSAPWDRAEQEFEGFGENPYSWSDTLPENTIVPDFWGYVEENPAIEVWITEGWDKALTLLCHGRVAVSVYGSTSGYKVSGLLHPALIPDLKDLAQKGRSFVMCLDRDQNTLDTGVDSGIKKTSTLLEAEGCTVSIALWDSEEGKGVDDAIANQGDRGTAWLDGVRAAAVSFKAWKSDYRTAELLNHIERSQTLTIEPERVTEGGYFPNFPEDINSSDDREIIVATSGTGNGKTEVMKQLLPKYLTIVLGELNALTKQTAERYNLPHRHDFENNRDQRSVFSTAIAQSGGLALCFPSIDVIPSWVKELDYQLLIDEATQVVQSICSGSTSGLRHSENLEMFAKLAESPNCKRIILSQNIVTPGCLEFIKETSGITKVQWFKHEGNANPYHVTLLDGVNKRGLPVDSPSGYWARFIDFCASKKVMLMTASQSKGEAIELVYKQHYPDKKVVRLDSKTNESGEFDLLQRDSTAWFEQNGVPDLLIISPSAKSGVSITYPGFDAVWGYFYNLGTDDHVQMLGRYRPAVPRFVYCPSRIFQSRDEAIGSRSRIIKRFKETQKGLQGVYGIDTLLSDIDSDDAARLLKLEESVLKFHAGSLATIGVQKAIARDALACELRKAGNTVNSIECQTDNDMRDELKEAQDQIWREESEAIAKVEIDSETHTEKWAKQMLSGESTTDQRRVAHKVLWRLEFPGVTFDDAEMCYQALTLEYGALKKGILLHVKAENLQAAKELDEGVVKATIGGRVRVGHNAPKALMKATTIAATGILNLIEELRLEPEYTAEHPIAVAVAQTVKIWAESASRWADDLRYLLRMSVHEKSSPIDIVDGLMRKLGLDPQRVQVGVNEKGKPKYKRESFGKRNWVYHVPGLNDPIRCQLFEAAQHKLAAMTDQAAVPAATVEVEPEFVPTPEPVTPIAPTHPAADGSIGVGAVVRYGSSIAEWVIEKIDGSIAHIFSAAIAATGYGGRLSVDVGKLKLGAWEVAAT